MPKDARRARPSNAGLGPGLGTWIPGDAIITGLAQRPSGAGFTPEHERERCGQDASNNARPDRNEYAADNDVPPQDNAKQVHQRDNQKNNNGRRSKWLHSQSPFGRQRARVGWQWTARSLT